MVKKILWLSDSPMVHTGYANQTLNILNRLTLTKDYECHQIAHNSYTQTIAPGLTFDDGTMSQNRVLYTLHGNGREPYGKDILLHKIASLRPDYFCVLLDTFMLYDWILKYNFSPAHSLFYFPSDGGGGLPHQCDQILKHFNTSIAMSKFAQRQAQEMHGIQSHYIPHGVETTDFFPMSKAEKEKIRAELEVISILGTKFRGLLRNKYVVGCVARNQGRKMLDRAVKAFIYVAQKIENAVLYMHCDLFDTAAQFDMRLLVHRLGLQNRVFFSPIRFFDSFPYKKMVQVYNAMDLFILPTTGEGFGIPTIEAMACGIPCIVTDYTTTRELLVEELQCGLPVPYVAEITGGWSVERAVMDEKKAADAILMLHQNKDMYDMFSKNARDKVVRNYSWDVVMQQWTKLFSRPELPEGVRMTATVGV